MISGVGNTADQLLRETRNIASPHSEHRFRPPSVFFIFYVCSQQGDISRAPSLEKDVVNQCSEFEHSLVLIQTPSIGLRHACSKRPYIYLRFSYTIFAPREGGCRKRSWECCTCYSKLQALAVRFTASFLRRKVPESDARSVVLINMAFLPRRQFSAGRCMTNCYG